ncbi:hypothetical protein BUE93_20855 [Chromobacterium amazonense]|uniref:Uncharacterized protein n=1 Tax=Chromobacterium amazonense TaxID=1382803 RepID=A0A2S9WZ27_9NEIS|nr:hypothetical protein [Chromobacterium amazonense]PRP68718.1 hypothetical protein BUE93_20855 [Chromobacterium amazonense]
MTQSQLDRALVREIFRVLRGSIGNRFLDNFKTGVIVKDGPNRGHDAGVLEAMDVWAHKLRHLTPADVRHGLQATFKHPPSADEFITAACAREITPPTPTLAPETQAKLAAPTITREQAEVHIAQVAKAAKSMRMPQDNRLRLDNWLKIADEVERGVYKGGTLGKRMAAEALQKAGEPVPAVLQPYLPKTNPMEDAA